MAVPEAVVLSVEDHRQQMIELERGDASGCKEPLDAGQILGWSRIVREVERIDEQSCGPSVLDQPVRTRRGQSLLDRRNPGLTGSTREMRNGFQQCALRTLGPECLVKPIP